MVSKWVIICYNLLINGVYWGYNPPTNHLETGWDIQVGDTLEKSYKYLQYVTQFGHPWELGTSL